MPLRLSYMSIPLLFSCTCVLSLSLFQVSTIIWLWQNLLDYDKTRVVISAHQGHLKASRFRSLRKNVRRHVRTAVAPLSQFPDCCRLVENIFLRLCVIHRSPEESAPQWDLIIRDYRRIRQLVVGDGRVTQQTNLQLVEVSRAALVPWHSQRVRRQDALSLRQGLNLPVPLPVENVVLVSPPPHLLPPVTYQPPHLSNVPEARSVIPLPPCALPATPLTHAGPGRKLTRKAPRYKCKKCGQYRTTATGHSQYRGIIYCPSVETMPKEQWLKYIKNIK